MAMTVEIKNNKLCIEIDLEKPTPSASGNAIHHRRCIVPASGFFEWTATPKGKVPHYITARDGSPFSIAGIWETWKAPDGGMLESFALLTTDANRLMATIHERMPVILQPAHFEAWLDRSVTDPQELQRMYLPYPDELMQAWQVSTFVNSPAHIGEECIHRVTE